MNLPATQERSIDHALARWVGARSGSELLARAAFAVSQAEGQGHACVALVDDAAFTPTDIAALGEQTWVGLGDRFTPFVLDEQLNFYTWRNWQHETRLAAALRSRAQARTLPVPGADLHAGVDELFAGEDSTATLWQRVAVAAAPGSRLFVLTGGPGTGKTATVVRLLLILLVHARACGLPARPLVALAAPTGKAARRLAQAITKGKQALATRLAAASPLRALLDGIAPNRAQTLHRLLGLRPTQNTSVRDGSDLLAADIVVVDEASMVDLAMMRRLVEALRPQTLLILLGDPGQLAAVESGSVLSDIVAGVQANQFPSAVAEHLAGILPKQAGADPTSIMSGQVISLSHVWRAGSGLQRGIDAIGRGDLAWLDAFVTSGSDGSLSLQVCADVAALRARVDAWIEQHAAVYAQLIAPDVSVQGALDCLRGAQILCALRDGAFGAQGINARVARALAARFGYDAHATWYHGRPVLVTHNDYARGLFNGDVGVALQGRDGLRVWFESGDGEGAAGVRSFSTSALPVHETAWAMTIHRSQGSEYDDVAVVLPPDPEQRVLSRELLYTAVSRATRSAQIWATAEVLHAAAARPILRRGGLREKMR